MCLVVDVGRVENRPAIVLRVVVSVVVGCVLIGHDWRVVGLTVEGDGVGLGGDVVPAVGRVG